MQKDIPGKKFLETLSFVLPAKTTVGLILENCGLGRKNKYQRFKQIFSRDIFLYLLNIFATAAPKLK